MNITKLNKPFVAQTILTAAQLNSVTDKIDTIIDNLPSTPSGNNENDDNISQDIIDAKNWITGKIEDLQAMIDEFEEGHTTWNAGDSFLNLFKGSSGREALVYYGLIDSNGHPFFNVLIDENGVKPAAIIGAINGDSSQIGISANKIIIDGNTTLTEKLIAVDAAFSGRVTAAELSAHGENSEYPAVIINSTDGIKLQTNSIGDTAIDVKPNGSGSLANGKIRWNQNGDLEISGTFKIGAKYIEYLYDNSVEATVSFSETNDGITANITITNGNNFDVYCAVQWYADGTSAAWSASGTTDMLRIPANSSRTIEDGLSVQNIPGFSTTVHPSIDSNNSGADLINVYHYVDRLQS